MRHAYFDNIYGYFASGHEHRHGVPMRYNYYIYYKYIYIYIYIYSVYYMCTRHYIEMLYILFLLSNLSY